MKTRRRAVASVEGDSGRARAPNRSPEASALRETLVKREDRAPSGARARGASPSRRRASAIRWGHRRSCRSSASQSNLDPGDVTPRRPHAEPRHERNRAGLRPPPSREGQRDATRAPRHAGNLPSHGLPPPLTPGGRLGRFAGAVLLRPKPAPSPLDHGSVYGTETPRLEGGRGAESAAGVPSPGRHASVAAWLDRRSRFRPPFQYRGATTAATERSRSKTLSP